MQKSFHINKLHAHKDPFQIRKVVGVRRVRRKREGNKSHLRGAYWEISYRIYWNPSLDNYTIKFRINGVNKPLRGDDDVQYNILVNLRCLLIRVRSCQTDFLLLIFFTPSVLKQLLF